MLIYIALYLFYMFLNVYVGKIDLWDDEELFPIGFPSDQLCSFAFAFSIWKPLRRRMTMGRTGLDFINVLHTAFTPIAPQSVRTQSSCQYLFMLSGSMSVKAVRRTLMKLSPGLKFINDL